MKKGKKAFRNLRETLGFGFQMIMAMLAGFFIGRRLDQGFAQSGVFTALGFFLGLIYAFVKLWQRVSKEARD